MKKSKYYKENKHILEQHKTKCYICGEDSKCCLEFHHIKDKLFNISQSVSLVSTEQFKEELKKCICVCKNCHTKIHNNIIKLKRNEL